MTWCRTVDQAIAAAQCYDDPPLSQEQADHIAALLASVPERKAVAA